MSLSVEREKEGGACPVSTRGGTRRVQLVREGRGGGGVSRPGWRRFGPHGGQGRTRRHSRVTRSRLRHAPWEMRQCRSDAPVAPCPSEGGIGARGGRIGECGGSMRGVTGLPHELCIGLSIRHTEWANGLSTLTTVHGKRGMQEGRSPRRDGARRAVRGKCPSCLGGGRKRACSRRSAREANAH
jgi:hypothetical protein